MSSGLSLGPRSVERPSDAGMTLVGVLDSLVPASVDGAGLLQLSVYDWSLDWWIGADDRWYLPAREVTVRQRRLGYGPVLETVMRIPSGEARHRVYSATMSGRQVLIVEVENDSPVPVALAMAVRPYGLEGKNGSISLSLEGDTLRVDQELGPGPVAIRLPREPNEFGTSTGGRADIVDVVTSGGSLIQEEHVAGATNSGVVLYPLPHRTTLRFVLSHGAVSIANAESVPGPDDVAKGWNAILDRGGRFSFPDPGLTQLAGVARSRLLVSASELPFQITIPSPGSARVLKGLATAGAVSEVWHALAALVDSLLHRLSGTAADTSAVIAGVGRVVHLIDDPSMVEELLEPMTQLTQLVEKSGDRVATVEAFMGLASLLLVTDQPVPAHDLIRRASQVTSDSVAAEETSSALALLTELAEEASPSGSWGQDEEGRAATFWLRARALLIDDEVSISDEAVSDQAPVLRLLPEFPHAWKGGQVEVHGAATAYGRLSYGIRWHGYRPALLWDLEPGPRQQGHPVTITCPGLDSDWSTTELRGETLLSGSAEDLPQTPTEGESFQ